MSVLAACVYSDLGVCFSSVSVLAAWRNGGLYLQHVCTLYSDSGVCFSSVSVLAAWRNGGALNTT